MDSTNNRIHKFLLVTDRGSRTLEMDRNEVIVGREGDAHLVVGEKGISRRHLRILFGDGEILIEDLGSSNGTWIGGKQLLPKTPVLLSPDQVIGVGSDRVLLTVIPSWAQLDDSQVIEEPVQKVDPQAVVLDRQPAPLTEAIIRERRKLEALEKQKATEQSDLNRLRAIRESLEQALQSMQSEVGTLDQQTKKLRADIDAYEKQTREAEEQLRRSLKDADSARNEQEHAKAEAEEWRANVHSLREEASVQTELLTRARREQQQAESLSAAAGAQVEKFKGQLAELKRDISSYEEKRLDASALFTQTATDLEEIGSRKTSAEKQLAQIHELSEQGLESFNRVRKQISDAKEELDRLRGEVTSTSNQLARNREELSLIETASLKASEKRDSVQLNIQSLQTEIKKLEAQRDETISRVEAAQNDFKAITAQRELDRANAELNERKRRADQEAQDAERKVERLKIEVDLESAQVRKAVIEKEMHFASSKKQEFEAEIINIEKTISERRAQFQKMESEHQSRMQKLNAEALEVETAFREKQGLKSSSEAEIGKIRQELAAAKSEAIRLKDEAQAFRAKVEQESAARRAELEQEFSRLRVEREKELESEFLQKLKQSDANLSQKLLDREKEIEQMLKREERAIRDRRREIVAKVEQAAAKAVSTKVTSAAELQSLKKAVAEAAALVLSSSAVEDGDTQPVQMPTQESRYAKRFWAKAAGVSGAVLAAGITLALFPQLPSTAARKAYRAISSKPGDDNVFLSEIRKKGEHFQPETARIYRDTYTENVLYAEAYLKMKNDESARKKWTLSLNDFFIGALGIGDRKIVDFMGAEAALVKELASIAEQIGVQFKDSGVKKMQDAEKDEQPKLEQLVGGADNYRRFRQFEKSFYEEYLATPGQPVTSP